MSEIKSSQKTGTKRSRQDELNETDSTEFDESVLVKRLKKINSKIETKKTLSLALAEQKNPKSPWCRLPSSTLENVCSYRSSCTLHKTFAQVCSHFRNVAKQPNSWHPHFAFYIDRNNLYSQFNFSNIQTQLRIYSNDIRFQWGRNVFLPIVSKALYNVAPKTFRIVNFRYKLDEEDFLSKLTQHMTFTRLTFLEMSPIILLSKLQSQITNEKCKYLKHLKVDTGTIPNQYQTQFLQHKKILRELLLPQLTRIELSLENESDQEWNLHDLPEFKSAQLPDVTELILKNIVFANDFNQGEKKEKENSSGNDLIDLSSCRKLTKATFADCKFSSPKVFDNLKKLKQVNFELLYSRYLFESKTITEIAKYCHANSFSFGQSTQNYGDEVNHAFLLDDEFLLAIANNKNITSLELEGIGLPDDLHKMGYLIYLKKLIMMQVTSLFDQLQLPPNLLELRWNALPDITSPVIQNIIQCPNLTHLDIDSLQWIPDQKTYLNFMTLTKLSTLVVSEFQSIDQLNRMRGLENNGILIDLPRSITILNLAYNGSLFYLKSAVKSQCPIQSIALGWIGFKEFIDTIFETKAGFEKIIDLKSDSKTGSSLADDSGSASVSNLPHTPGYDKILDFNQVLPASLTTLTFIWPPSLQQESNFTEQFKMFKNLNTLHLKLPRTFLIQDITNFIKSIPSSVKILIIDMDGSAHDFKYHTKAIVDTLFQCQNLYNSLEEITITPGFSKKTTFTYDNTNPSNKVHEPITVQQIIDQFPLLFTKLKSIKVVEG